MKKYIITCCLSFGLLACGDDFLDLKPQSNLTDATFYQTEDHFNQALTGAYESLRSVIGGNYGTATNQAEIKENGLSWNLNEMRSDNTHYDYNSGNRGFSEREVIADFLNNYSNKYPADFYASAYKCIARTNTILARISSASFAEDKKAAIIGQAKFIRALSYFHLVRYFGGVPIITEEIVTDQDAYKPRATVDEVYNLILEDAKDADAKLAAPAFPQTGRATKGAAKVLLADVYLTRKQYALAETELKLITTMGYSLLPDYKSVFSTANKNSAESIFEIQYLEGNQGLHSNWIYAFIPRLTNTANITGTAANNTLIGGWNVPTDEMLAAYEPGDLRKNASIGIAEGPAGSDGELNNPTAVTIKDPEGYVAPGGTTASKPFIRKFQNTHGTVFIANDNWPLYRYAEVLLMLAEALNEQGKTGEAISYLNQVRNRAGLANTSAASESDVRAAIWNERRIELAFENKRWFDLIRMPEADAINILTAHGNALKAKYTYLAQATGTYQITKDLFLYPIPQRERNLNPEGMPQNPGYTGQ